MALIAREKTMGDRRSKSVMQLATKCIRLLPHLYPNLNCVPANVEFFPLPCVVAQNSLITCLALDYHDQSEIFSPFSPLGSMDFAWVTNGDPTLTHEQRLAFSKMSEVHKVYSQ